MISEHFSAKKDVSKKRKMAENIESYHLRLNLRYQEVMQVIEHL